MPVHFCQGDIFASSLHRGSVALAHGCNCKGAMGKGIAVEFRDRFPEMYQEYRRLCRNNKAFVGGYFMWTNYDPPMTVFNLFTQRTYWEGATLGAVKASVQGMLDCCAAKGTIQKILMPRVGAGLGRLDWEEVKVTLEELCQSSPLDIFVAEEYRQGIPLIH